jgi:3-hydroxyacyl-[acyl-carrier-protein] dehydratase
MRLVDAGSLRGGSGMDAEFSVTPDSAIFSGHFPHFPLLPGVFFVEAALQLLEANGSVGPGPARRLACVSDLRLLAPAPPGIPITLAQAPIAAAQGEQAWSFRFSHGGQPLARVTLALGRQAKAPARPAAPPLAAPVRLGAREIANRLPHRPPILLVDRARAGADGRTLQAHKLVSLNEPCYGQAGQVGMAPELDYPAALLIESFVQACALLVMQVRPVVPEHDVLILGGVREARFHGGAGPGTCVRHDVALKWLVADTALLSGTSRVGARVIAQFKDVLAAVRPVHGIGAPAA